MTVIKGVIIGLASIVIIFCIVLVFVRMVRACASSRSTEGGKKMLAIGLALTVF